MTMATAIRRETPTTTRAPTIVVRERKATATRPSAQAKAAFRAPAKSQPAPAKVKPKTRPAKQRKPSGLRPGQARPAQKPRPIARAAQNSQVAPQAALDQRTSLFSRLAPTIGFGLAGLAIVYGWLYRDDRLLRADSGLGYALGVVSVSCMLLLLVYPLRKRLRFLRFLGSVKNWFRTHMQLGVLGPLAALYHCNFQVGSLNSQIALYCALAVAGSGIIGRFLYRKIHRSLYGRKTDLNQVRAALLADRFPKNEALPFLPLLKQQVHRFDHKVLQAGETLSSSVGMNLTLGRRARRERRALGHFCQLQLDKEAQRSRLVADHRKRLQWAIERYLFAHMMKLRLLAKMQAYERMFALWHVVHLPFFVLLVISVIIHVLAVHLY